MLEASPWRCQIPVVLPRSCVRHLTPELPKLQRSLHQTATLSKAMQRENGTYHGKHAYLVQQSCL